MSRLRLASLIFLGWTIFGMFVAIPEMLANSDWRAVLIDKVVDSWAWALLTPLLILVDCRIASRQTGGVRVVLLFLLLSVPVSLGHTYLAAVLLYPFSEVWWSPLRDRQFGIYFFLGSLGTYGAVVAILQAVRFHHRYLMGRLQLERVERSLVESRLTALRLHLEPHFLFNALNAISSEVAEDPQSARNMIANLGALLRRSLDCKDSAEISLAQELSLLGHYLSIQKVRFGDRMEIEVEVEPEMLSAMVPSMLLQPLVENAIRHGIERRMSGGRINVCAAAAANQLRIEVMDDGVGLPDGWELETSSGHGIRVTRERLIALYPGAGENCFNIARREGGGTKAVLSIPLQRTGRDDEIE